MNKIRAFTRPGILLFLLAAAHAPAQQIYTNLHSFINGSTSDGAGPNGLVTDGRQLWGATVQGGSTGNGLLFSMGDDGANFMSAHDFAGGTNDGASPNELLLAGRSVYGTTYLGGTNGSGTVFRFDTNNSTYTILRSFTNSPDPGNPVAGLVLGGATLYGTSLSGGSNSLGTVFKLDTNGANFTVLHHFSGAADGSMPRGRLLLIGATLYGAAATGGSNGVGTVFKLDTNGTGFTVLYNFSNAPAATAPYAGLVSDGTVLYGTSTSGGSGGLGTVFKLDTNGAGFAILHSLTNNEGLSPQGVLILTNGMLLGSTLSRGTGSGGIVFQLATNGANFTVLQNFTNAINGANPKGQMLLLNNILYGSAGAAGPNGGGTIFSLQLTPFITVQPLGLTVTNGNPASFTSGGGGVGALGYQWYLNGLPVAGANSPTLAYGSVTTNLAGSYTFVVTNFYGSATSSPAILTVLDAPDIISPPQSLTVTNGNPASFSVTAVNGTLTYQWYFNTNTLLLNQTNSTYNIPAVTTNNAGAYTVVVANNIGSSTSSPAILSVSLNTAPGIAAQPTNQTVVISNNVTFAVSAFGLAPLNYQWYSNSVNTAIGTPLARQTNSTLNYTNVGTNLNARYYSVVITNTLGKITSSPPALLTVVSTPLITTNPQSVSVIISNTANFFVTALGPNLRYQWYSNSVNTAIGLPLLNQTNSNYSFTAITNANGRYYSVVVTNNFGKATSSPPALLTIGSLYITLQPLGLTITNGSSVTFTSAAAGPGPLGYQWLFNTNTPIAGATATNLVISNANAPGAYAMVVTNSFGAATSSPAILTVVGKPILLASAFDPANGSYSFSYINLAGSTNRLWATTNLANFAAWQAITTNIMATNGTWNFTDTNTARTNALRLYRFSTP